ncbi:MAG: IS4 family transposase, partial [Aestuariivita sp.]|nr:IS4 family transposase [Aestuariivita sp.]
HFHRGCRSPVVRRTLAKAHKKREGRIDADFAQSLSQTARRLYADDLFQVALEHTVDALGSTTINLRLSGVHFRRTKAAVKRHTLLN